MTIFTDLASGALKGEAVVESRRVVRDLAPYWLHPDLAAEDDRLLYVTQTWLHDPQEYAGLLLWGNTVLQPGTVGDEFFMTRGHRHLKTSHGELVVTVSGTGYQMMSDPEDKTVLEPMSPGSTHWVPGNTAHRTINTGEEPLVFFCAWPADCGHDYESVLQRPFRHRVLSIAGKPHPVRL